MVKGFKEVERIIIIMDLSPFKLKKTRAFTAEQDTAGQIYEYFGRSLSFPRIMRLIKTIGRQKIYDIWNEIKQSDCKDSLKLFIWKTKKENLK